MAIIDKIKAKAAANVKTIVLPAGEEERNVQAAAKVVEAAPTTSAVVNAEIMDFFIKDSP